MINLRLDVDYPFPSRWKSFLYAMLNQKSSKDYLKNSKIIAKMINESEEEVRAYWFFTPHTIPDNELLRLLCPKTHEVSLHIANDPFRELENLEVATSRKIRYYTIHGTARLPARLMWRRKIWEDRAHVPNSFPLQSFYDFPTLGFDLVCYNSSSTQAVKIAKSSIAKGEILHIHPEWLFQRGTINHRGPFYEPLKQILAVDQELSTLVIRKRLFAKIAKYHETIEYERDFVPNANFIEKIADRGVDIFTFLERTWCNKITDPSKAWFREEDNVALLEVTEYSAWMGQIGKKTRNMVRKAEKSGVDTKVVEADEKLAEGIWKIYNDTPIRQERAFPHYGQSLQSVKELVSSSRDTFIGAYLEDELAGFIELVHGDKIAIISQILSLQKHSDKAINNALIAKAVEICASKAWGWLMYARMGNHPSLDSFKRNNGFKKFPIVRYYLPITRKGRIATRIGLQRNLKDALPDWIKYPLIPAFNWASRSKIRFRNKFK